MADSPHSLSLFRNLCGNGLADERFFRYLFYSPLAIRVDLSLSVDELFQLAT